MAELSKQAQRMAYDAGHALPTVQWPDDATPDQRRIGEHHSPFDPNGDDDQRAQHQHWLRGLRDAMSERMEDQQDGKTLLKRLDDSIDGGDHAG